jgi:hypothetical protein
MGDPFQTPAIPWEFPILEEAIAVPEFGCLSSREIQYTQ